MKTLPPSHFIVKVKVFIFVLSVAVYNFVGWYSYVCVVMWYCVVGRGYDSTTGTSGDDGNFVFSHFNGFVEDQARDKGAAEKEFDSIYNTPTKELSKSYSAHSTGYSKKRTNSLGLVKLQHFSESKRTSGFWKERLGKRDLTSVLGSPLSRALFWSYCPLLHLVNTA